MQRYTPAKVRRALARKLRVIVATKSRARQSSSFSSLSELRAYALSASGESNNFSFTVKTGLAELPVQLRLGLPGIKSLHQVLENGELTVTFRLAQPIPTGQAAWAVATLATPGLAPLNSCAADVALTSELDAALAYGHRIVFGGFGEKDASNMESENARRVEVSDRNSVYFDLAAFNPIGLRLREQAATLQPKPFTFGYFNLEHFLPFARKAGAVRLELVEGSDAGQVAGLAATGLLLQVEGEIQGLHPELEALITKPLPNKAATHAEMLQMMMRSERQRRLALIHHAGAWRLQSQWPAASVLLVTNRASMLPNALKRIAEQTYPNFEVLVGLHNISEVEANAVLQNAYSQLGDRLRTFHFDSNQTLGAIYGSLTERSDGVFLAKFDDDDYYGKHHLWDSIISLRYSGAGLFGRTPTMTWLDASNELLLRPFGAEEIYGKYIIGATMVMSKAALLESGGWRPTPWAVDKALIDRFNQSGAGIYRASQLGWAYVRHNQGHTWLRDESHFRGQAEAAWIGDEALQLRSLILGESELS